MDLKSQRNIAAKILKCGKNRVWFDPSRPGDIAEAITTRDVERLIKDGVIKVMPKKGISNFRKKKLAAQKKKGRRKGAGSRKGRANTRAPKKKLWIKRIRAMRNFLKELRDQGKMEKKVYRELYMKAKGGFFRNKSHLNIYIERNKLLKGEDNVKEKKAKKD